MPDVQTVILHRAVLNDEEYELLQQMSLEPRSAVELTKQCYPQGGYDTYPNRCLVSGLTKLRLCGLVQRIKARPGRWKITDDGLKSLTVMNDEILPNLKIYYGTPVRDPATGEPITRIDGIVGKFVLLNWCDPFGRQFEQQVQVVHRIGDKATAKPTENTWISLEFGHDNRHCWVLTHVTVANLKAVEKVQFAP